VVRVETPTSHLGESPISLGGMRIDDDPIKTRDDSLDPHSVSLLCCRSQDPAASPRLPPGVPALLARVPFRAFWERWWGGSTVVCLLGCVPGFGSNNPGALPPLPPPKQVIVVRMEGGRTELAHRRLPREMENQLAYDIKTGGELLYNTVTNTL